MTICGRSRPFNLVVAARAVRPLDVRVRSLLKQPPLTALAAQLPFELDKSRELLQRIGWALIYPDVWSELTRSSRSLMSIWKYSQS